MATLETDAVEQLRASFNGEIVEPGDDTYDELRTVFNGMFDRYPAVIARPTDVSGVQAVIQAARSTGVPFAIRSGGHSVAGFSSNDGGIVLDLRQLDAVSVDPEARTA